jgi:asparagine synthase (glutamine-hydrolysing)
MNGIAGSFDLGGGPADPCWIRPPAVVRSGIAVSFDGRLDNRDELIRLCAPEAPDIGADSADAAVVAAAYERAGEGFASRLNGDFAFALVDTRRRRLVLARDVMGARRLHYIRHGETLRFASDITSLLSQPGVQAMPDEAAIAEVVLDRWVDGHRTGFKNIFSVPPGHTIVAANGRVDVRRAWTFDPSRQIRYTSFDEYLDEFRSLFAQAVRRRMRSASPIAVSVSGGVDSSAIFCQAAALAAREPGLPAVRGISMAFPDGSAADERAFVEDIEAKCGARITRLPVDELRLLHDADRVVGQIETPQLVWDAHHAIYARARRDGAAVLLDGYFGDQVLFPRAYLIDLARRGRWRRVRRDLRTFGVWMDGDTAVFRDEFRAALLRSLLPRPLFAAAKARAHRHRAARYPPWYSKAFVAHVLERQLTRFGPPSGASSRHAEECHRNATAGHFLFHAERQIAAAAMHGVTMAFPFRDRDLVAFFMAIPGEIVSRGGIPKGLLREGLDGVLPDSIRDRRTKADFTPFTNRAAIRDYDAVATLLSGRPLSVAAGFVDGPALASAVQSYRATIAGDGTAEAGWRLTEVAALELWMRHFFGAGVAHAA